MNPLKYLKIINIFISAFISMTALNASALTVVKQSLEDTIRQSALIVHGTVMKVETVSIDQRTYTISTLRVHEALKGTSSHTLMIHQLGGVYKGLSQVIIGIPLLKEGEEWVLFLSTQNQEAKSPKYGLLASPYAATQVIKGEKGEKIIKHTQSLKEVIKNNNETKKDNVLHLIKVKPATKLSLRAPIFKVATPNKTTKPLNKDRVQLKIKKPSLPKVNGATKVNGAAKVNGPTSLSLTQYISNLKTAIDRSLAPQAPSH
jgi:hypothetical protein